MFKQKFIAGWIGEKNERSFYKNNVHSSEGLSLYIQNLIENLKKTKLNKSIEVHFNSQFSFSRNPKYLILLEHKLIRPQNFFIFPNRYRKIFGWDLDLEKYQNFCYVNYPHFWNDSKKDLIRKTRYTMICSNRNLLLGNKKYSLYNKRQEVINYCESNKNLNFNLYGTGWNNRDIKIGFFERILQIASAKKIISLKRHKKLINYKGIIKNKSSVLRNSKFNFCFENIAQYNGYVSEKIWDSISSGAIPVYWPSWDIPEDYLPKNSYIDASKFKNVESLFNYLENISDQEIINWSNRLIDLAKKKKKEISIEKYSKKIVGIIEEDLKKKKS